MTVEKKGITNIIPVLFVAIELGNVGDKMGRSKGAARYGHLLQLTDELMGLGAVDFSELKKEIKDLDAQERLELHAKIKEKFDIVDDKLEIAIEKGLELLEMQYQVVEGSIALYKEIKGE